ncbi:MAG: Spy/CpxP family protein refolding chaperone [Cyanobacteriota bacterium]
MWSRHVFLSSVLLLVFGGAIALVKPSSFFSQSMAQNLGEQKPEVQGELKFMAQLNLTQEQQQKLRRIHTLYKDKIFQRKQAVRQATQELRSLMVGTASSEEIRAKFQEVQTLRQQLEDVSLESMLAMREVFTPTQRNQFARLMEQQGKISYQKVGSKALSF